MGDEEANLQQYCRRESLIGLRYFCIQFENLIFMTNPRGARTDSTVTTVPIWQQTWGLASAHTALSGRAGAGAQVSWLGSSQGPCLLEGISILGGSRGCWRVPGPVALGHQHPETLN